VGNLKNFATGTVLVAPSPATSGTSVQLQSGEGANMPAVPFYMTAHPDNTLPTIANAEIVQVTARSSDTLTIVRGISPTSAKSIATNWRLSNAIYDWDLVNGSTVYNEVPGGSVNGSNTVFTIAGSGKVTGTLIVTKNGVRMKNGGADFTETSGGFTMVTAPAAGTVLLCDYRVGSSSDYSVGSNSTIVGEVPSGAVNGSNAVFTTARAYIAGTVDIRVNGLSQARTTHFTETSPSAGTITLGDAPDTGDVITVSYQYNLNPSSNADTVDGIHASSTPIANQLLALDGNALVPNAAMGAAWQSYTPTWTLTGAASQAITSTGGYVQIGKTVHFWANGKVNNSSNFSGLSSVFVSLPVNASAAMYGDNNMELSSRFLDSGTAWYSGKAIIDAAGRAYIMATNAAGTYASNVAINSGIPFSWGLNDTFNVNGTYEAA
jgi:hypothetical protein